MHFVQVFNSHTQWTRQSKPHASSLLPKLPIAKEFILVPLLGKIFWSHSKWQQKTQIQKQTKLKYATSTNIIWCWKRYKIYLWASWYMFHGTRLTIHTSWYIPYGTHLLVYTSQYTPFGIHLTVHPSRYTLHDTHLMVRTNYSIQEVGADDQLKAVLVTKASLIYIRPYLKK